MADQSAISIAIEGVIGAGKTTLAQALSEKLGALRLLETDIDNPFLERFYKNRNRHALACQLCFLQGRMQQFTAAIPDGLPVVADHSLVKEQIFSSINLSGDEYELYQRLAALIIPQSRFQPDVTIYLKADMEELGRRIQKRGLKMESDIGWPYLEQLINAYEQYYAEVQYERVVVVSSDSVNIAEDEQALRHLIRACLDARPGLSYCNPIS